MSADSALAAPCPRCRGRRHYRTTNGWARCECYTALLSQLQVQPILRGTDATLPPDVAAEPPWPLTTRREGGTFQTFRRRAWRALLPHVGGAFTYDCFEGSRLVEVYFGNDPDYPTFRDLIRLDLAILLIGVADTPNKLIPTLTEQAVTMRTVRGKPTWVFTAGAAAVPPRRPVAPEAALPDDVAAETVALARRNATM